MKLEINKRHVREQPNLRTPDGTVLMITPPINEDYWVFRVPVSKTQAVVGFPKFGTVGIGFQKEEDWNTNLPYTSDAEKIYDHIKHNKACRASREKCVEAIRLIQEAAEEWNK